MGRTTFMWRGKLIPDIHQWATEHQQPMIRYRAERTTPNHFTGQPSLEAYEDEMPESFWLNLCATHGWRYTAL